MATNAYILVNILLTSGTATTRETFIMLDLVTMKDMAVTRGLGVKGEITTMRAAGLCLGELIGVVAPQRSEQGTNQEVARNKGRKHKQVR